MMKAARVVEFGKPLQYLQVAVPEPGPTEVLLNVKAAGYCSTDNEIISGHLPANGTITLPHTPSHEPAGVVAKIGSAVTNFKVGDRAAGLWRIADCEHSCSDCKRTDYIRCSKTIGGGVNGDGAMAEYMVVDSRALFQIPDSMPFEEACVLVCAGATVYGALKASDPPPDGTVAIIGVGGLGLLGLQMAKALGYKVVAIDLRDSPLAVARNLKLKPDLICKPDELPNDLKVNSVINCTASLKGAVMGLKLLAKYGTFVQVGECGDIPVPSTLLIHQDVRVRGSLVCTQEQVFEMVRLVTDNKIYIDVTPFEFENANELIKEYKSVDMHGRLVLKV